MPFVYTGATFPMHKAFFSIEASRGAVAYASYWKVVVSAEKAVSLVACHFVFTTPRRARRSLSSGEKGNNDRQGIFIYIQAQKQFECTFDRKELAEILAK